MQNAAFSKQATTFFRSKHLPFIDGMLAEIVRGSLPFVAMLLLGWAAVVAFPALALWLPATMLGSGR